MKQVLFVITGAIIPSLLASLLVCNSAERPAVIDASDEALIHCSEPYCPRSFGMTGVDTAAKLAIIKIWRGPDPARVLKELFPKCNDTGKAYVLGALWHFDKEAFKQLVPGFINGHDMPVASYDMRWTEPRTSLVSSMQQTNSTLSFSSPPRTKEEIGAMIEADAEAKQAIFEKTLEWKKAAADYALDQPWEEIVGQTVTIKKKKSNIPYTIDWGWEEISGHWQPTISIDEITEVIDEISGAAFIQAVNDRISLDIALYAVHGNFYRLGLSAEMTPQEDEDAIRAKALVRAAGYSGTNKLIQITARSSQGPLVAWHPQNSHFWLIVWNLKISPEWEKAYKEQTGLELADLETGSGWLATCDDAGVLKMIRSPLAKTIAERVKEEMTNREHKP